MRPAPTIRLRLTLWYGGLFLFAGLLLLAANFVLVARNFPTTAADLRAAVAHRLDIPAEEFQATRVIPFETRRPGGRGGFPVADLLDGVRAEIRADTLEQLAIQSGVALAVMAVVSAGLGWMVAGRMLRPLNEISATVRRISDQNLAERVSLGGPADELRQLADQFDVMLDRLQSAFVAQREFVANASHELRTPLTIMRTELDVTLSDERASAEDLRQMAAVIRRAIDRTERLIDGLLVLASAEAPVERAERVDLADFVRASLAEHAAEAEALDLDVQFDAGSAAVTGNGELLERLVANLVENAIRHNVRGGPVAITTAVEDGRVVLRVASGGERIPPDAVEGLFERFARLDRSRSRTRGGYGLGLAIVRAIAVAHGGTAAASARAGGGLEVVVRLPA